MHCPCKNTAFFLASLFESSCPENHSDTRIHLALMSSADTFITLHRERKVDYAPDWSVPVNLIVSKNKHGFCGTCRMYFIPQIMLFKGSCIKESFVSIPDIYEPVTPYGENQNHRLSRWYAPRLQGDCAGSPTRALKRFANRNFFTGYR